MEEEGAVQVEVEGCLLAIPWQSTSSTKCRCSFSPNWIFHSLNSQISYDIIALLLRTHATRDSYIYTLPFDFAFAATATTFKHKHLYLFSITLTLRHTKQR